MPPPFKTSFPQQDGSNALQTISLIGQIQSNRANLQLGKEKLQFDREQAAIQNAQVAQQAQQTAQRIAIDEMNLALNIVSDPTRPIEILKGGYERLGMHLNGGQPFSVRDEDVDPIGVPFRNGQKILKEFGVGPELQTYMRDTFDRFGYTEPAQEAKRTLQEEIFDVASIDGRYTPDELAVIRPEFLGKTDTQKLFYLNEYRRILEGQGQSLPFETESLIASLTNKVKGIHSTSEGRAEVERIRKEGQVQVQRLDDIEASRNTSKMVLRDPIVKKVAEIPARLQEIEQDTEVRLIRSSLELQADDPEKVRELQRQLGNAQSRALSDILTPIGEEIEQNSPQYKQAIEEFIPQAESDLQVRLRDMRRRGEPTDLIEQQLEDLAIGKQMIEDVQELPHAFWLQIPSQQPIDRQLQGTERSFRRQQDFRFTQRANERVGRIALNLQTLGERIQGLDTKENEALQTIQSLRRERDLVLTATQPNLEETNRALEGLRKIINNAAEVSGAAVIDPQGNIIIQSLLERDPRNTDLFIKQLRTQVAQSPGLAPLATPFIDNLESLNERLKLQKTEFKAITKALPDPLTDEALVGKKSEGGLLDAVTGFFQQADEADKGVFQKLEEAKARGERKRFTVRDSETGRSFVLETDKRGRTTLTTEGQDGPVVFILEGLGKDQAWVVAGE